MFTIRGIPTAGIAVGTAFVLQRRASAAATAAAGDPVAEAGRFHAALERAKAELSALAEGEAVFAAHLEMAGDPMLAGLVERRLAEKHLSAEQALGEACEEVCGMFAALDDDYLRGRTDDVRDVGARIGRILSGETAHDPFAGLAPGTIVVAAELARLPLSMRERPVYASDVRSFYEEKGAGGLTLNLDDLARYEKPRILMAGDRKIGVVAVDYYASARQLEKLHDELASAGAESFVCLVPRLSCLASTDDFNVVIVTDDAQAEPGRGEGEGNAHIVYAPERGQVGGVLLTSLNVPSSKVYASL